MSNTDSLTHLYFNRVLAIEINGRWIENVNVMKRNIQSFSFWVVVTKLTNKLPYFYGSVTERLMYPSAKRCLVGLTPTRISIIVFQNF